jgi:hypothetical protein
VDNAPPGLRIARAAVVARLATNAGRPADAVKELERFEDTFIVNGGGIAGLLEYGRALLLSGRHDEAVTQLGRLVSHPGVDPVRTEHTAALVWLARANAASGKVVEARRSYETFLARMKRADEDVPLLKAAKEEYSKLQGT